MRHPAATSAPASAATGTVSLRQLCAQLVHHLEHDDFASSQLVDDHEDLLRSMLGSDFDPFAVAVHDFSFGTALELLKRAMAIQGTAP